MRDIIAWAALLFSGISLILSLRTKRRQDELMSRQIAAHDRDVQAALRANVIARVEKDDSWSGSGAQWRVVVENKGPADARHVELEFKSPQQLVPASELGRKLPLEVLPAGEHITLVASRTMGQPSKYEIMLRWRDSEERSVDRILVP